MSSTGKKKKFGRRTHGGEDMSLNITAMADIFVVILVFLLKGFSSGAMSITPSAGLTLPNAFAEEQSVEALKLEIAEGAVSVEGQPAVALKEFAWTPDERQGNGTLKSLSAALEKARQRQLLIAKANSDVKVDARVLVIADQRAPYSTLKAVLASAAVHGYTDFKLVVAKSD
jgi:biopolymer transport protein ExbD